MSRIDATSIYQVDDNTKAKLKELYGGLIKVVQPALISSRLKNTAYTSISAGSVEVRRLQTSSSQAYGTARAGGYGNKVKADPVSIAKSEKKEIVEEWMNGEAEMADIPDLVGARREDHALTMVTELDTAFFGTAVSEGTDLTATVSGLSTLVKKLNKIIQTAESTKNEWVKNGVPRSYLALTVLPEVYDEIADMVSTLQNPLNGNMSMDVFKGVEIFRNINQTKDVIVMARNSIGQPVDLFPYKVVEPDLGNEIAVKSFYNFGTGAVTPDLIYYADVLDEEVSA